MEIIQWYHVWLFTRIDSIHKFIECIAVISTFGMVIWTFIFSIFTFGTDNAPVYKIWQWWFCLFVMLFFWVSSVLMPTQKEFAAIYLIPKMANSEFTQTLAKETSGLTMDAIGLMRAKVTEWSNDIKEKENKKKEK